MEPARAPSSVPSPVGEGRVLAGKYRLEQELRSGAMGAVYRAHHLTLDKTVCIKIMHAALAGDEQFARRFHREARAASRFDHPNSILILDHGTDTDGTLYIAMELVEGRDLFDIIEEANGTPGGVAAAFPARRTVDLLSQALAAVAAAHDVGILHRDLKPENIMVSASWDDGERVKVCDFGIAHMDDDNALPESGRRLTRKGFILGTPEYMSPEQAKGETIDGRSDVYAAGCVLYQLLTGRCPFEDESAIAVTLMQINSEPKAPSELVPGVNRMLEAVCLRALKKNPAERFASAREMRAALRDAVSLPHSTPIPLLPAPTTDSVPTLPEPMQPPVIPGVNAPALVEAAAHDRLSSLPAVQVDELDFRPKRGRLFALVAAVACVGLGAAFVSQLRHEPVIATANAASAPAKDVVASMTAPTTPVVEAKPVALTPLPVAPTGKQAATPIFAPAKAVRVAAASPVVHPANAPDEPVVVPAPEPEPTPVQAPAEPPAQSAPPPPAPVVEAAIAPAAPSYALDTAHVDIGVPTTIGATAASVERAIAPMKGRIDLCYRAALPHAASPSGSGVLHLETDDVGNIRKATVTGALTGEIGACIARAATGRRIANVDTGHAVADVPLVYRPR